MGEGTEVYKSIAAVTGELAKEGITKDRKNQQQGFAYRGIDDVYAALSPLLSKHNLCILPRIVAKESAERTSAKGGVLFYNLVTAEFDIVSSVDGSRHTVISYGEAFDSGDKSIGKAMSYAYKAMAFMTFAVPTEGDNDPDANCHEVKPKTQSKAPTKEQPKGEMAEVQISLGVELSEFCNHNEARMAEVLKEVSFYVKGEGTPDAKEGWIKLEDLKKPSSHAGFLKWCGSALSKLRNKSAEIRTDDIPF